MARPVPARPSGRGPSRRVFVPLWAVAIGLLCSGPAEARPIRTNTPGTGVFIGSGLLVQGICEERSGSAGQAGSAARPGRAVLSSCTVVGDFRYTPATHWVIGIRAPLWVERELDLGDRELTESGPGDVEVSGKWRFFRQVGSWFDRHAALEVGVKLATGESDLPDDPALPRALAHRLPPGTGSTDAFVDLIYQQGQRRFVWGGDLEYRWRGDGEEDYRFGDEISLDLDGEYVLFPRDYTTPGNEVFVLLEATVRHRFDDELGGRSLPTGGTELLLAPGVQHIATEQMLLSLSLQLPVWEDLDRLAPQTDWNLLAEVRYAF